MVCKVFVLGMGKGNPATLTDEARDALAQSTLVVGSSRLLESLRGFAWQGGRSARKVALVRAEDIARELHAANDEVASVVLSGDVGFYSGATRLYELVAEKSESNEQLLKYMENWEKVLKVFEARDYAKALEYLKKLSSMKIEQYPDDKVAKYYISLIENFFIKGTYPTDKDDAGVAFNPENGVFTLLQK